MTQKKWTEEDADLLKSYCKEGLTHKEISILLKRSLASIKHKTIRLKLSNYISLQQQYPDIAKYWHPTKNNITSNNISCYSGKNVWWICEKKHEYQQIVRNKVKYNNKCPYCCGRKVLKGFNDLWTTHPEICNYLVNPNDGYIHSRGHNVKVEWICDKGHRYKQCINHKIYYNLECPKCNQSKGERKVSKILDKYNIIHEKEKIFDGCKNKRNLRFDFYLLDYNICIEYQGKWHYTPHWSSGGKEKLKTSKKRDKIKRDFCIKESINLIEIPYWDFNNIEQIIKDIISNE